MQAHEDLRDLESRYPIDQLAASLEAMWRSGWHPLDVARLIGPNDKAALHAYVDALSISRQGWHAQAAELWASEADDLGAGPPWWDPGRPYWQQFASRHKATSSDVNYAALLVGMLTNSPQALPLFEPSPYEPGPRTQSSSTHNNVLAKVRALLAKAESTTFDHEAEALSAKAQQLISRHSIDIALLATDVDVPGGRRIYVDSPYAKPKFTLLAGIADANNCRSCWGDRTKTATLMGHQADMHLTEVMFTSLLLQGTNAILAAGAQLDTWGQATTRSWRNSFWYGYANRIGQRLEEASQTVRAEHEADTGQNLLPVLAARSDAVEQAFEQAFPNLGTISTSISNYEGLQAGHAFADKAELSGDRSVPGSGGRALSA